MKILTKFLVVFLFVACSLNDESKNKTDFVNPIPIQINVSIDESEFQISNYVQNFQFIPIESNPEFYISSVSKVCFSGELIFLFDIEQQQISILNKGGKLLNKIDNQGNGPNEYLRIEDFIINDDKTIEVLDVGNREIKTYNQNNQIVKSLKFPFYCARFNKDKKGNYLFFCNNQTNNLGTNKKSFNLICTNKNVTEYLGLEFPILPEFENLILEEPFTFTPFGDDINFSLPLDNTIYFANSVKSNANYKISFGKFNLPIQYLNSLKTASNSDRIMLQMKILNKVSQGDFAYNIHSVFENRNYLFFQFRKSRDKYSVLYNKKLKEIKVGKSIVNDIDINLFGQPIALNEQNQLVTCIFPYEIENFKANYKNSQNKISDNRIVELLKMVNTKNGQLNNPIIQLVKLKE